MKIKNYWPQFLQELLEFGYIADAEQPEFEAAVAAVEDAPKDFRLETLTLYGVSRWEAILGIAPLPGEDLSARRFRIRAKLSAQLPYTMRLLDEVMAMLCGANNYSTELKPDDYWLQVKVGLAAKSNFNAVDKLLQNIVPANMIVELLQLYNSYQTLSVFTHQYLAQFTHDHLRSEVMT